MLPPGRPDWQPDPYLTGSSPMAKTIGIVEVALAASAAIAPPVNNDLDLQADEFCRDSANARSGPSAQRTRSRRLRLDTADLRRPSLKAANQGGRVSGDPARNPIAGIARLLRPRRQRPRRRRPAEQRDELAAPDHSITSSARASSCRRNLKAERLGSLEVDDQIEFRRLLNWQIARIGSLDDLVDERAARR